MENQNYDAYIKNGSEAMETATVPNAKPKAKVINLVDTIKDDLVEKSGDQTDFAYDLDIIKSELLKTNPDLRIVELKMEACKLFSRTIIQTKKFYCSCCLKKLFYET